VFSEERLDKVTARVAWKLASKNHVNASSSVCSWVRDFVGHRETTSSTEKEEGIWGTTITRRKNLDS